MSLTILQFYYALLKSFSLTLDKLVNVGKNDRSNLFYAQNTVKILRASIEISDINDSRAQPPGMPRLSIRMLKFD